MTIPPTLSYVGAKYMSCSQDFVFPRGNGDKNLFSGLGLEVMAETNHQSSYYWPSQKINLGRERWL